MEASMKMDSALAPNAGPPFDKQVGASVDLGAFLIDHCQSLSSQFPGRVNFVQRFENDLHVTGTTAQGIGEILNLSVENTVRHAHPAGLSALVALDVRRLPDGCVYVDITDDGVGLPENFDVAANAGKGFVFMRQRAESLGGQLAIQTGPLGMSVRFTLAAQANDA
jgi:two-component sensor histidine kinase